MRWALVVVAACASSPPSTLPPQPPQPPPPAPTTAVVASQKAPLHAVEAPHGSAIVAVAVSTDGKAAVSIDRLGGARLWPTLDGTREPRVIDLPAATALAIARRGAVFVIAALDQVGGIYLAQIDEDGHTRSHVVLPIEPAPYRGMAMTARGLLAWRADQTLVLIGDDGAVLGQLATEPGQRLAAVAVARSRAVAMIESGVPMTRHVRWLGLEPRLAWGSWIDAGPELGPEIALSPSGARLVRVRDVVKAPHLDVIETATGKVISDGGSSQTALGFIDEDHVAVGGGVLSWLDVPSGRVDRIIVPGASMRSNLRVAVVEGKLVAPSRTDLAIATPDGVKFLGYAETVPRFTRPAGDGLLMAAFGAGFAVLDHHLHVALDAKLALPDSTSVIDMAWLEGDLWLVGTVTADVTTTHSVLIADVARGTETGVMIGRDVVSLLQYEPTTHLAVLPIDHREIDRYDPEKHTLTRIGTAFDPADDLVLTAPALSGGVQVVHTRIGPRIVVDPRRDPASASAAPFDLARPVLGVDRAGRIYTSQEYGSVKDEIDLLAGGKQLAVLRDFGSDSPHVFPSPTGDQVVMTSSSDVVLYDQTGRQHWRLAAPGIVQAVWLGGGELALSGRTGIVVVDVASGAMTAARCGWHFELSTSPHQTVSFDEPLCAQLRP